MDNDTLHSAARRRLLRHIAATGVAGGLSGIIQQALSAEPTQPRQGIRSVSGTVLVNGKPAKVGTAVPAGATVVTQAGAEATFVVGRSAFMQRAESEVVTGSRANAALRVVGGALLAVFPKGTKQSIRTPVVTAGIRGTGCYIQLDGQRTYFCLCYGGVELAPDGGQARSYSTTHHDTPYWIEPGGNITSAGFLDHSDAELTLLERLVGRKPPFAAPYYKR